MKIIDGNDSIMGRIASYSAKEALQGEDITIINCDKIIISGNKEFIQEKFEASARKHGTTQKGPIVRKTSEKLIKRVIRGMLPDRREGRGKAALRKIKCYAGVPKEFEGKKTISLGKGYVQKSMTVKELVRR